MSAVEPNAKKRTALLLILERNFQIRMTRVTEAWGSNAPDETGESFGESAMVKATHPLGLHSSIGNVSKRLVLETSRGVSGKRAAPLHQRQNVRTAPNGPCGTRPGAAAGRTPPGSAPEPSRSGPPQVGSWSAGGRHRTPRRGRARARRRA